MVTEPLPDEIVQLHWQKLSRVGFGGPEQTVAHPFREPVDRLDLNPNREPDRRVWLSRDVSTDTERPGPVVSVIICTHDPRPEYLCRVIQGLVDQTLDRSRWELLIVDNASATPVADRVSLEWHPAARIVIESELGLISARLRGMRETSADIIVFVDDDNVLDPDYLEVAVGVAAAWPMLGAWGGQLVAEFEQPPEPGVEALLGYLGIRTFAGARWTNLENAEIAPVGAGLCLRREVGGRWAAMLRGDPIRRRLGLNGTQTMRCEDLDLAFTACDIGLGLGIFEELRLTHLMPAGRVRADYLIDLVEGHAYSYALLQFARHGTRPPEPTLIARVRSWAHRRRQPNPVLREYSLAIDRGQRRAASEFPNAPPA